MSVIRWNQSPQAVLVRLEYPKKYARQKWQNSAVEYAPRRS